MNLEPVIGLEIHVQLKTKSKMFCRCDNDSENKPINSCICEICMGHPGTLPMPNKLALIWTIKTALALNCTIADESKFDRKHYFYPDLPKGYQISQYDEPFGRNGFLISDGTKVRIHRLHLEEDAAKLLHAENKKESIVDYNRAGTPLIEIVTEPDIHDPKIAGNFLRELRAIMRALSISYADMEKGHLRCDANISLRETGKEALHPKTEIKNLNSFKAVERSLFYEIKRQTLLWEQNTPPQKQSTRGWNEEKGITEEQREKEEAHDYRYFPEPDIPPIKVKSQKSKVKSNENEIDPDAIRQSIPELPQEKRERFHKQYEFSFADASIITRDYALADYTEKVISELLAWIESAENKEPSNTTRLAKLSANWLINNLSSLISNDWENIKITPENFAEFITLIAEGKINSTTGQKILKIMAETGKDPTDIISEENLAQTADAGELLPIIEQVINENPKVVNDYRSGKTQAIKFLMGSAMKLAKGKANPGVLKEMIKKTINSPLQPPQSPEYF